MFVTESFVSAWNAIAFNVFLKGSEEIRTSNWEEPRDTNISEITKPLTFVISEKIVGYYL